MRIVAYLLLISLVLTSCNSAKDDRTLSFNGAAIHYNNSSMSNPGWFTVNGHSIVDSTTVYKKGLHSLLSMPNEKDTLKNCQTYYRFNTEKIEGGSISFKGVYKLSGQDRIKITFGVQQILSSGLPITYTMEEVESIEGSDWLEFDVATQMNEEAVSVLFFVFSQGGDKIWTSNWQARINDKPLNKYTVVNEIKPIEEDKEFDKTSTISLDSLTDQMIDNLEVLGKVWGFLKYYHPEIVQGKYNWDYELFRVLPQVTNAKDKEERSKLINTWIDKYGKIKAKEEYIITDPDQYSRIINLDWLNNETVFSRELINKLNDIKKAKRSKKKQLLYVES